VVCSDPRVDRQPIVSNPGRILRHGVRRIAVLPRRAQRRDHVLKSVLPRPTGQLGEGDRCRAALVMRLRHRGGHEAEGRGLVTGLVALDCADQRVVVPLRQVWESSIPGERNAPSAGDHVALTEDQDVVAGEVNLSMRPTYFGGTSSQRCTPATSPGTLRRAVPSRSGRSAVVTVSNAQPSQLEARSPRCVACSHRHDRISHRPTSDRRVKAPQAASRTPCGRRRRSPADGT
jgi:hypothetical protein